MQRRDYYESKELLKKNKIAAGIISERFPTVTEMVLQMTYYQKISNAVLMVRTVNFSPTCYAYFIMNCMTKGCKGGGYDLSDVIAKLVKDKKTSGKGKISCTGDEHSVDLGTISYQVNISYRKK